MAVSTILLNKPNMSFANFDGADLDLVSIDESDVNTTSSFYGNAIQDGLGILPVNYAGHLVTLRRDSSNAMQVYTRITRTYYQVYLRKQQNGTWGTWGEITLHSGKEYAFGTGYYVFMGFVSSAHTVEFVIPLNRYYNSNPSFSHLFLRIWNTSGTQVVSNTDVVTTSGYSISIAGEKMIGIRVSLTNSSITFGTVGLHASVQVRPGTVLNFQ